MEEIEVLQKMCQLKTKTELSAVIIAFNFVSFVLMLKYEVPL